MKEPDEAELHLHCRRKKLLLSTLNESVMFLQRKQTEPGHMTSQVCSHLTHSSYMKPRQERWAAGQGESSWINHHETLGNDLYSHHIYSNIKQNWTQIQPESGSSSVSSESFLCCEAENRLCSSSVAWFLWGFESTTCWVKNFSFIWRIIRVNGSVTKPGAVLVLWESHVLTVIVSLSVHVEVSF